MACVRRYLHDFGHYIIYFDAKFKTEFIELLVCVCAPYRLEEMGPDQCNVWHHRDLVLKLLEIHCAKATGQAFFNGTTEPLCTIN
jgi:hypothetical protein